MNSRPSFEEFVRLGVMNSIHYATIIILFRERLLKDGVIEELFEVLKSHE